jgi:hypothetical protein
MFTGPEPVFDILLCINYRGCGLMFVHNNLGKHVHVLEFMIISHVEVGRFMLSFYTLYECDALATLRYFGLGSGKLDPAVIRKTHPRSIQAY